MTIDSSDQSKLNDTILMIAKTYLAYDDLALETFANTGLLRRAKKDVLGQKVSINNHDDKRVILSSDEQQVILPASGLNNASCACPSVSACKHILASVLYLQSLAEQVSEVLDNEVLQSQNPNPNPNPSNTTEDINNKSAELVVSDQVTIKPNIQVTPIHSITALDEVMAFSLSDLQKIAKSIPKAKRLKVMHMALALFDTSSDGSEEAHHSSTTIISADSHSVTIQLASQSEAIRYILGTGFAGMLSKIERDADSFHWLALIATQLTTAKLLTTQNLQQDNESNESYKFSIQQHLDSVQHWLTENLNETSSSIATQRDQLSNDTLAILVDIKFDIAQLLHQGLSHIDSYSANRMHLANTLARSQHLPRLATQLRQLSGLMHDYVNGDNQSNERQILLSLAELSAYLYQLRHSRSEDLSRLRGQLRQSYDSDDKRPDLTLLPLGARWWYSQGKARGLSLYFYDINDRQVIEFTQARAQSQDISFDKHSAWYNAVWMSSAQSLMNQISTLANPRFNDNGGLAVTSSKVIASQSLSRDFDSYIKSIENIETIHNLQNSQNFLNPRSVADEQESQKSPDHQSIVFSDWQQLTQNWQHQLAATGEVDKVLVLNPAKIGTLVVDEIEQCLWWPLADQNGNQIRIRLNWSSSSPQSMEIIKKLECLDNHHIKMIVVYVTMNDHAIELTPMTLIMNDRLFHLDYSQVPNKKNTLRELLSGTISKLMSKKRNITEIDNTKPKTLTELICEPVLVVLDSLSASGRLQPTEHQIQQLRRQNKLASDAGLTIFADTIAQIYSGRVTVDRVLKLAYVSKVLLLLEIEIPVILQHK